VPFQSHVFDNGLQIIGETSPSARSVALGFFVRTGARDETKEISGVTHFLEHMVFKGTPNRTAEDVNRDFDRIGAHYNAFTSEENTVFYAAILPEYLPAAVDILADILRPSLRNEDFDMEKNVIIEEIGMYEDQPMWSAYDHAKRIYFADHPLGKSILGTAESIRALTRDQIAFVRSRATRCLPISSAATSPQTSPSPPQATSTGRSWWP
jgi:predicted Zn-dependent peptidase